MKTIIRNLLLLAMAGAVAGAAEFHDASGASKAKSRQEWIEIMSSWLKSYRITPSTPVVEFWSSPAGDDELRNYANEDGLIRFPNGEWVLVTTHSGHQEEGRTRVIGDICVALTSRGELYENGGHACPHLILRSKAPIISLDTFLTAKGLARDGSERWKKLEVRNDPSSTIGQRSTVGSQKPKE